MIRYFLNLNNLKDQFHLRRNQDLLIPLRQYRQSGGVVEVMDIILQLLDGSRLVLLMIIPQVLAFLYFVFLHL